MCVFHALPKRFFFEVKKCFKNLSLITYFCDKELKNEGYYSRRGEMFMGFGYYLNLQKKLRVF